MLMSLFYSIMILTIVPSCCWSAVSIFRCCTGSRQPFFRRQQGTRMFSTTRQDLGKNTETGSGVRRLFDLSLADGQCVGMQLLSLDNAPQDLVSIASLSMDSHWIRQYLHPAEIDYGMRKISDANRPSFLLGRVALREALKSYTARQQPPSPPPPNEPSHDWNSPDNPCILLKDKYGRPSMPSGYLGSISHKRDVAVGFVSSSSSLSTGGTTSSNKALLSPVTSIGVDLERRLSSKRKIGMRILTDNERASLGQVTGLSAEEEVVLRFSVKEALYKAMHPLICQFVACQEAEAQPNSDGSVDVKLNLKSGAHKSFDLVQAHWTRVSDDYFVTTARIELAHSQGGRPGQTR